MRSLKELSQAAADLAVEVSKHHTAADMPVQWEIERASAALLLAKSRLASADRQIESKDAGAA
jgi:hypothetical protein